MIYIHYLIWINFFIIVGLVNNLPIYFPKTLFIDNDKIILGFKGQINILDIKSGNFEKTFMVGKEIDVHG